MYSNRGCSQLDARKSDIPYKDARKGNAVSNYRPISCLNLFWKLLTGIINEKCYDHLNQQNLLPKENKGCQRKTRGTKDQSVINW